MNKTNQQFSEKQLSIDVSDEVSARLDSFFSEDNMLLEASCSAYEANNNLVNFG
jgi:hypothetical protein